MGPSFGMNWAFLGQYCAILGLFRAILGLPWAMFCNFGAIEGHLGVCPCLLGPFLGQPGVCLGHLGAILGFLGAIFGLSWGIFRPSSGHLEARLGFERTGEERKDKERTEMGQFSKTCTAPRREHHFRYSREPCRGLLGAVLGHLGFILGSWGDLGSIFWPLGANLGAP